MPSSRPDGLEAFIKRIMELQPKSILDVGCGFGKYGFLCREYLDIWATDSDYHEHTVNIEGIEVFRDYTSSLQLNIYDWIYEIDATVLPWRDDFPTMLPSYDLIIMSDILEHMDNPIEVLDYALSLGKVYVKTPTRVTLQGEVYGNVFETHKGTVPEGELRERGEVEIVGRSFIFWGNKTC